MWYKILTVVCVLALCITPVFAADEDIEYLCEEHNCLRPSGVDDAVCAVCFFGGIDYPASIPNCDEVSSFALQDDISSLQLRYYTYDYNVVDWIGDLSGNVMSSFTSDNIADLSAFNVSVPDETHLWGFSWSPVREAYYVQFPDPVSTFRMFLTPYSEGTIYRWLGLYPDGLTFNVILRGTASDGSFANVTKIDYVQPEYRPLLGDDDLSNFSSARAVWGHTGSSVQNWTIANKLAGYHNIWFGYPVYKVPTVVNSDYPNNWRGHVVEEDVGYISSSGGANNYTHRLAVTFDEPCYLFELKRLMVGSKQYDVSGGVFPSGFANGGVIPGVVYPSGEGSWADQQFEQGVNPELSSTASGVTDGVDSLIGFEDDIYSDLSSYGEQLGLSDYRIPTDLAASFAWVSNKFMSFFDAYPDLKLIVLFPAYLGLVVAIVHGLEFAGRSLSRRVGKSDG